jgi:hypothetical protein
LRIYPIEKSEAEWVKMVKIAEDIRNRKCESALFVCFLVTMGMIALIPLSVPPVSAIDHINSSTMLEDGDLSYDLDGIPNGIVIWDPLIDHAIMGMFGYNVDPGYTLHIPAMAFDPITLSGPRITLDVGLSINVFAGGTLLTSSNGNPNDRTAFMNNSSGYFDGIYFQEGSSGRIEDVYVAGTDNGIVFGPGSTVLSPSIGSGINSAEFTDFLATGLKLDGAQGETDVSGNGLGDSTVFRGAVSGSPTAVGIEVSNCSANITQYVSFISHGDGSPSLRITNATVEVGGTSVVFLEGSVPGYGIHVKENSDDTYIHDCSFQQGVSGNYYIRVDGSSPLIDNCSFVNTGGQETILANNGIFNTAHPLFRNPNPGGSFDNSTIVASGNSSVHLQWWVDVYVIDPLDNPIKYSPVWFMDSVNNPAQPPSKTTDIDGYARWFLVTELIQYNGFRDNFNPFNISAKNNTVTGYANLENSTVTTSRTSIVFIEFLSISNNPPIISYISTPVGVQSGNISIDFIIIDLDPIDDGNLSIEIYFTTDGITWFPTTLSPGSDPTSFLNNNTLYTIIWVSDDPNDLPNIYNETVQVKIIPFDVHGPGTPGITGTFIVDNLGGPPPFPSPPFNIIAHMSPGAPENIDIMWNASPDDGGGENDVVGYTVYRSTTGVNGTYDFAAWLPAAGSMSYVWVDIGVGDGDWNNYFYIVRANDTGGNEEANTDRVGKFVNYLTADWNLVSIPLIQRNSTLDYGLQTIKDNYIVITKFHAGMSRPWLHSHTKKPKNWNDDIAINHLDGYYIKMLNPDYLVVAGEVASSAEISLTAGWNLVGFPCLENKTVEEALGTISGKYNKVEFYNTSTAREERLDPDDLMIPGMGYWIHATSDCIWEVPI